MKTVCVIEFEICKKLGLTINEYIVCDLIHSDPKAYREELSRATGLTPQAIGGLIKKLVKKGFVIKVGAINKNIKLSTTEKWTEGFFCQENNSLNFTIWRPEEAEISNIIQGGANEEKYDQSYPVVTHAAKV